MKKPRVEPGEKCPICGKRLKNGDKVRFWQMTVVSSEKRPRHKTVSFYVHAECNEKQFPKKQEEALKRKIGRQMRKNKKKKK